MNDWQYKSEAKPILYSFRTGCFQYYVFHTKIEQILYIKTDKILSVQPGKIFSKTGDFFFFLYLFIAVDI